MRSVLVGLLVSDVFIFAFAVGAFLVAVGMEWRRRLSADAFDPNRFQVRPYFVVLAGWAVAACQTASNASTTA